MDIDTEPVVGAFVTSMDDTLEMSYEKNRDIAMCFESTKIWMDSWRPSPSATFTWMEVNVGLTMMQDFVFPTWTRWDKAPSNELPYNVRVAPPEVGEFAPNIDVIIGRSVINEMKKVKKT